RKEDIMPLAWHYITLYNSIFDKNISCITKEAKIFLKNYNWEGNVRELKNTVKSIFSLIEGETITMKDLTLSLHNLGNERNRVFKTHFLSLEEFQQKYIEEVLKANDFNIKKTAQILKISRNRLYRKLKDMDADEVNEKNEKNESAENTNGSESNDI
ncbi:MAG: hypothetical protein GY757_32310, partial [bacterium]|nr:hypothetical protein [bacterium]